MSPENGFACLRGQDKFVSGHGAQCQSLLHCPDSKGERERDRERKRTREKHNYIPPQNHFIAL